MRGDFAKNDNLLGTINDLVSSGSDTLTLLARTRGLRDTSQVTYTSPLNIVHTTLEHPFNYISQLSISFAGLCALH